jgi:dipeptidase E
MILAWANGQHATPIHRTLVGGILKLLLTSGGVTSASIRQALVDLLGKPIADSTALCIPTAQYGHP